MLYEVITHLSLASAVYGVDETVLEREGNALLERFRMTDVKHHLPDGFSKGMRQKMMLMIGFLIRPDIYIVDEPFVGLDPRATMDFLALLVITSYSIHYTKLYDKVSPCMMLSAQ